MTSPGIRFRMWFLSTVVTRIIKAPPVTLTKRAVSAPETADVPTRFGTVRCLITKPADGAPLNTGTAPVYVNFHGGAFLIGNAAQDDHLVRGVAGDAGAWVVNVDYTTAPKFTFPKIHEECYDVLKWVAGAGADHGWDPSRIAVGGGSAGANLALGVIELSRRDNGPAVKAAILTVLPVDMASPTSGYVSSIDKPMVSPALIDTLLAAYLPIAEHRTDPLASPLFASDEQFAALPPLLLTSAEYDTLRPGIEKYLEKAKANGVDVTYHQFAGVDHDFPLSTKVPKAIIQKLSDLTCDHLVAHLA